jgi:hypothetical protein
MRLHLRYAHRNDNDDTELSFTILFHFVWVIRKLDNFEEHSGMDEATSEDLAFTNRPRGNPTKSGPRTV